ncbi:hypothetical protein [Fructilactobacillus florum]|uniref:Morphogenesis protein n=1 Tax=Fructilactobacillus florum DSM 22689 = JCM 16035 TaxID=1423745 RepID=A0A0R2CTK4_9LACO|nr:hypothetical protein [Fructilactobacillus florum]KRM91595.1 hypothetical protein FC87_GL000727 [Fructilactobacillus florum DSM 22689 = JCM 16035]
MSELTDVADQITRFREQCDIISGLQLYVGVPKDDEFLTMIALVNENGKTITPQNGQWLCIPVKETVGKKPSEISGLFRPKGKNVLAVSDKSQSNGIRVMYILRKSVTIPPRPFLRTCLANNQDKWMEFARDRMYQMLNGDIDAHEAMNRLGDKVVKDLKKTILELKDPHNAPLTVDNKGADNPLIQTGKLYRTITYVVAEKGAEK